MRLLSTVTFLLALTSSLFSQQFDSLVWADEFNVDGGLDTSSWWHQTVLPNNGQSWWNGEIQHYTNRDTNTFCDSGYMHLMALKETFTDQNVTKEYTSARLNSKFAFTYGRVEVRAQLPTGVGTWPAIWMLGQNITEVGAYWETQGYGTTGWPACGEIDIMEHWGHNQDYVSSAMHTPSSFGGTINVGGQWVSGASTGMHTYAVEWTPTKMVFSVDSIVHYTYEPTVRDMNTWPFDAPQYLLLNTAILPSIDSNFVSSPMIVDYVRIYQSSALSQGELEKASIELFPNPSTEVLTIVQPYAAAQFEIFDLSGKLLLSQQINHLRASIAVEQLASGNYKCVITDLSSKQQSVHSLVIQ